MPYKDLNDLPKSVQKHLPKHAQEIYRAAFNSAWDEYAHDEERAHKVAWSAVKKKYERMNPAGNGKLWIKTRTGKVQVSLQAERFLPVPGKYIHY